MVPNSKYRRQRSVSPHIQTNLPSQQYTDNYLYITLNPTSIFLLITNCQIIRILLQSLTKLMHGFLCLFVLKYHIILFYFLKKVSNKYQYILLKLNDMHLSAVTSSFSFQLKGFDSSNHHFFILLFLKKHVLLT